MSEKEFIAEFTIPKLPTKFSFGICMVNNRKIPTDTNQKYQIGKELYKKPSKEDLIFQQHDFTLPPIPKYFAINVNIARCRIAYRQSSYHIQFHLTWCDNCQFLILVDFCHTTLKQDMFGSQQSQQKWHLWPLLVAKLLVSVAIVVTAVINIVVIRSLH